LKDVCVITLAASSYVSICGGFNNSNLFTKAFINLPPPGTEINLQDQFLKARTVDTGSANLPQISSIPTPNLKLWDKFLSSTDPTNHRRMDQFDGFDHSPNMDEAMKWVEPESEDRRELPSSELKKNNANSGQACFPMREDILAGMDKIIVKVKDDQKQVLQRQKNQLGKALTKYLEIEKQLTQTVADVQKLQVGKINWNLKDEKFPQIERFNHLTLGDMQGILSMTKSKTKIDDVQWMGAEEKEIYKALAEHSSELQKKYDDVLRDSWKSWRKYEALSKKLTSQGEKVMIAERAFYNTYARSEFLEGNNPCKSFKL
ncbi:MAG: hypothetical protein JWQ35_2158, partial [Bacteriovoracaceae bacterium]|nr:hypothetical protein [Bacteriovoracaceae bacterium]